jgi:hypothetical protein
MKGILKWLVFLWMILFALAGIVQWNDPDALVWMLIYAIPCAACMFYFLGRFKVLFGLVSGIVYGLGGILLWPDIYEGIGLEDGNLENFERGREAPGLFIIAGIMLILSLQTWVAKRSKI